MYKIQDVFFNKDKNEMEDCLLYIIANNYKIFDVSITKGYFRFRQHTLKELKKEGYNKFVEKIINEEKDIIFIIVYKDNNTVEKTLCC